LAALLIALAAPLFAAEPPASAGRSLANKHGCLGCHATQAQLVGPAYEAVAQRYRDEQGAAAALAQRIRVGSTGRWGTVPMPPQGQLGEADARKLATWILSGKP
jgi:cytochrome c